MPEHPIEKLLADVDWHELDPPAIRDAELYATHSGVLTFADLDFVVYQLSDGRRVFDADGVHAFLSGEATKLL